MIKAFIFDLDGVLVDLMSLHEAAFLSALKVVGGLDLGEDVHRARYAGRSTKQKLRQLVEHGLLESDKVDDVATLKQELTGKAILATVHELPARRYLMEHFQAGAFKLGCVTNCTKRTAYEVLRRIGVLPYLEAVVTNEDGAAPKPSPEPYRMVCGLLGVEPKEALVFEDHEVGRTAARLAGCHVQPVHAPPQLTVEFVWEAIRLAQAYDEETG